MEIKKLSAEEPLKKEKWRNPFNIQQRKEERERRQKKRARLIIRNLSYKANEEEVKKYFGRWGTLEEVNLLKRPDGKLVGCAFVQYETINQATKAILKANQKPFLNRTIYVDWALGKDEYLNIKKEHNVKEADIKTESLEDEVNQKIEDGGSDEEKSEVVDNEDESKNGNNNEGEDELVEESGDDFGSNNDVKKIVKVKQISNDVQEGQTIFIKNVPFEAEDKDLRKVCRKYGPMYYAIINRDQISGHSKGTAFVKFKTKESADLCLQSGGDFVLNEQILEPFPALTREEILQQTSKNSESDTGKDSRNLYLVREGLIMSGSKAAEGVSASDMAKRHKLEQIKTQVLKNLNRFVSRNRLSIHNLPLNYDNDKLKKMVIAQTNFFPHECRVMRENKITPDHPQGKSKGFGFMSFSTHKEAITALRKLNNHPKIFGAQHRPIVAFSIEDRAVHNIKEKRKEKSKLNNPTFLEKLEKKKEKAQKKSTADHSLKLPKELQTNDDKEKLKKDIKKLKEARAAKLQNNDSKKPNEEFEDFVGMSAKPGSSIRMRSNKKIMEQSQEHLKRVKANKRREKQKKILQTHLAERKAEIRPKQGKKKEIDDISHLVNKYKRMLDSKANESELGGLKSKKPKRTKWYNE